MSMENLVKRMISKRAAGISSGSLTLETPIKDIVMNLHDMFWLLEDLKKANIEIPDGKAMISMTVGDLVNLAKVAA